MQVGFFPKNDMQFLLIKAWLLILPGNLRVSYQVIVADGGRVPTYYLPGNVNYLKITSNFQAKKGKYVFLILMS